MSSKKISSNLNAKFTILYSLKIERNKKSFSKYKTIGDFKNGRTNIINGFDSIIKI